MLINFSNHPSSKWKDNQVEAAKQYGEIVDLSFPDIDPNWDENEINNLASMYLLKIQSIVERDGKEVVIHVAGEPTFCFRIIQMLLIQNIMCISSTTERLVEEIDGAKISKFIFVKFRKFKLL